MKALAQCQRLPVAFDGRGAVSAQALALTKNQNRTDKP